MNWTITNDEWEQIIAAQQGLAERKPALHAKIKTLGETAQFTWAEWHMLIIVGYDNLAAINPDLALTFDQIYMEVARTIGGKEATIAARREAGSLVFSLCRCRYTP